MMQALMLAAGMGTRLFGDTADQPPKAMLEFEGRTLFQRHLDILRAHGIEHLVLVVGYREADFLAAIQKAGVTDSVTVVRNPRYREGAVVSLWQAREFLCTGRDTIFMDADVLYHPDLIGRLVRTNEPNCLLLDRDFEPGDEPVKLCIRDRIPVDFGKQVAGDFDMVGEWPGFMRISAEMGPTITAKCSDFVARGRTNDPYEPAFREIMIEDRPGSFGFEDITGLPWIEIDFPEDVARARDDILPRIAQASRAPTP